MTDRRQQILDAALPLFVEKGYAGTTIADIRRASGATTGSIYHFFAGKPGIAAALWQDAESVWGRHAEALRQTRTAEDMVRSTVRGLVEWATGNRAHFLFFEDLRIRSHTDPDLRPIREAIARTHHEASVIYRGWCEQGLVRDLPWPLASALIVGPAYDYLRKCDDVSGHAVAVAALVDAAWEAVRAPHAGTR